MSVKQALFELMPEQDSFESLSLSVAALQSKHNVTPFIATSDISFEGFLDAISDRLKNFRSDYKLIPLEPLDERLLTTMDELGYIKVRNSIIFQAPGFKGKVIPYLTAVINMLAPLKHVIQDMQVLKTLVADTLNGGDTLKNHGGIPLLMNKKLGIDPSALVEVKGYFKPNTIQETRYGDIFSNVSQFGELHTLLKKATIEIRDIDFSKITKEVNSFAGLINDLKSLNQPTLSSNAVDQLATAAERVATLITLSSVIPASIVEWINAFNKSQAALIRDLM